MKNYEKNLKLIKTPSQTIVFYIISNSKRVIVPILHMRMFICFDKKMWVGGQIEDMDRYRCMNKKFCGNYQVQEKFKQILWNGFPFTPLMKRATDKNRL